MPPLGLAYLAASLKSKKIPVEILDINIDYFHNFQQYRRFWRPENYEYCMPSNFFLGPEELDKIFDNYAKKILETKAGIIGFSVQTTSSRFSIGIAAKIKAIDPSRIIIYGGPECSREIEPGYFLQRPGKGDYLVLGEGEETLPELVERISQGKAVAECRGLVMQEGEKIVDTGKREGIADLDKLPLADFSLFKLNRYLHKNSLPVITSRGCVKKCVFCFDTWHQGVYRHRSCDKIVKEIHYLYHNYSLRRLKFNDLLINGDLKLLEDICDNLITLRLNDLFWSGNMITREGMSRVLFKKMYRAGCRSVTFGLETASIDILKRMGKYYPLKELKETLKAVTASGINVTTNWIVGFPGETRTDLFNTMKFIANNRRYIYSASSANRLEIIWGSILFKNIDKLNIEFFSENTWRYGENDGEERVYRQRLLNDFMFQVGILNLPQSTNNQYRKKEVGLFETKKKLASFRKQLNLPLFL
jgi:radical SAM superfamily enzyme YgiQ (UPF0313 family)